MFLNGRQGPLPFIIFREPGVPLELTLDPCQVKPVDMRQGLFTYMDDQGGIRKLDILEAAGVTLDPYMSRLLEEVPDELNNFRFGDSTADQWKNSAG